MDLEKGDMLIFSGEGTHGSWERYFGVRSKAAIRSKLSREREGGARWASCWIEDGRVDVVTGDKVYDRLDTDLESVVNEQSVPESLIRENPAAKLATLKRGRSPASAKNAKKAGRPREL